MKRLMVVDDEAVIAMQLEDHLQSMKYDVVGTASSAEESVSMARKLCPDLILMDIVMEGKLDGIDAARMIKEEMDIPIIFLTAYADDKVVNRAMQAEPFGYIVKPFRENEIKANIEIALYRKGLEQKRKQAEERIRRLFLAIDHNPHIIMIIDIEGNIEFINNKFSQTIDYTSSEIIGKGISLLQSDKNMPEVFKEMRDEIASGEEWRGVLCLRKKDGTLCLKYTVAIPVEDTNGDPLFYILVLQKVVECEKRREELLQSEKMNSLRTVVSGVAHEFNNILAVVHGSAEMLEEGYEDEEELNKGLRCIKKASDKGAGIVRSMVTIAKSDEDTSKYIFFDLNQLIIQTIDFIIPGRKNISLPGEIKYQIDKEGLEEIPEVFCAPTELREVFINIINNALDAMPEGGRISFSTWSDERRVFASISDTGEGMTEETKRKIFDPFFTTRRPQRTGLGMGITHSIITRHGGKIEVENEKEKGTMLTLSIPIKNEIEQQKLSSRFSRGTMAKGLSILVVDDVKEICNILDTFFSRAGHTVKTVDNGAEAIELTKKEDFDLVLCDLVMPDATGYDVIKALKELDKVPKIGIVTGSNEMLASVDENALNIDLIIKKPFKLLELASKINVLFDNG